MNSQIGYLIEEFMEKYNDKPNLILIPKDMCEFEGSTIKWRYARYDHRVWDYADSIDLDAVRCC